MTWLVLAHEFDEVARWVAGGLSTGVPDSLLLVTDCDFQDAVWEHRLSNDGADVRIRLSDGRVIDSADIEGTVNRLVQVPPQLVSRLREEDREYALQEISALFVSWLAALPGRVLNPPDIRGLSGAWRPQAEWLHLAAGCGLATVDVVFDSSSGGSSGGDGMRRSVATMPAVEDVLVVGHAVFSERDISEDTIEGCRRLAGMAETPLLGLTFADGVSEAVDGITPLPDLRAGGEDLIDALIETLRGERCCG
jgi:hypothetical protein